MASLRWKIRLLSLSLDEIRDFLKNREKINIFREFEINFRKSVNTIKDMCYTVHDEISFRDIFK